jgi:hypothetical protein
MVLYMVADKDVVFKLIQVLYWCIDVVYTLV